MSLRLRLTLLFVALFAAAGLLRGLIVVGGFAHTLDRAVQADVRNKATEIESYLRDLDAERRGTLDLRSFDALPAAFSDDGMILQLTGPGGEVLNKSSNLGRARLPRPEAERLEAVALPLPHLKESPRLIMVTRQLRLGDRAPAWIQVAYPLQGNERTLAKLWAFEIGSWALMVLFGFLAGLFFVGKSLAPVAAMTEDVEGMDSRDLGRRLAVARPPRDELDRLGATFNSLFDRLESAFVAQRRFVADASHELKTPLTGIRGHLDLIRRRAPDHPEAAAGWARQAIDEVDRLIRLVGELLDLAQVSEGSFTMAKVPVDMVAIARGVAEQFHVIAPRVHFSGATEPLWVTGDADRLRQVVINLVDNALRATREGGEVTVEAARDGGHVRLSVTDTGVGMAPEALDRIFERFYRVDAARQRALGGAGLGLAITAAIVEAHQGAMAVKSHRGEGTRFDLRLPAG